MVVDNLYYGTHPFINAVETGFSFDECFIKDLISSIYEKEFNPMTQIDKQVFNETWSLFNSATDIGFGKKEYSDPDFNPTCHA